MDPKKINAFVKKHSTTLTLGISAAAAVTFIILCAIESFQVQPQKESFTKTDSRQKIVYVPKKEIQFVTIYKEPPKPKEFNGLLCVFTSYVILSDPDLAKRCIKMCQDMKCRIAILATTDIDLSNYDLKKPQFNDDYELCPVTTFEEIADWMTKAMDALSKKYNIIKPKVVFIDQNFMNCNLAEKQGFSTFRTAEGMQKKDIPRLYKTLENLL